MENTPNGVPYFDPSDGPNFPAQSQTVANFLDGYVQNWQTPRHAVTNRRSAAQTIGSPSGSWAPVTYYDVGPGFWRGLTYSAGVYTVAVAGVYLWGASVYWPGMPAAQVGGSGCSVRTALFVNGAEDPYHRGQAHEYFSPGAAPSFLQSAFGMLEGNVGDQLQVNLYNNAAADIHGVWPTSFSLACVA